MSPTLHLFSLRETERDSGTPVFLDALHPTLRSKVEPLAQGESDLNLRLPFLDRKECKRRKIVYNGLRFKRIGQDVIACIDAARLVREHAATLALTHEAWQSMPQHAGPEHFRYWQPITTDLQRSLREWMLEECLKSYPLWEDRHYAYSAVAYCGSRVFRGHPSSDFTYEVGGYPDCDEVVESSLRMCVQSIMRVLTRVEAEMLRRGQPVLARRYSPIWAEDILRDVQRNSKHYVRLLAGDAALVNGAVHLGTSRSGPAINAYYAAVRRYWGRMLGKRLHFLGSRVLDRVTELVSSQDAGDSVEHVLHGGAPQVLRVGSSRGPDLRIGV